MQSWKNFSAQLPAVDVSGLSKNLRNTVQATRFVLFGPTTEKLALTAENDWAMSARKELPSRLERLATRNQADHASFVFKLPPLPLLRTASQIASRVQDA